MPGENPKAFEVEIPDEAEFLLMGEKEVYEFWERNNQVLLNLIKKIGPVNIPFLAFHGRHGVTSEEEKSIAHILTSYRKPDDPYDVLGNFYVMVGYATNFSFRRKGPSEIHIMNVEKEGENITRLTQLETEPEKKAILIPALPFDKGKTKKMFKRIENHHNNPALSDVYRNIVELNKLPSVPIMVLREPEVQRFLLQYRSSTPDITKEHVGQRLFFQIILIRLLKLLETRGMPQIAPDRETKLGALKVLDAKK